VSQSTVTTQAIQEWVGWQTEDKKCFFRIDKNIRAKKHVTLFQIILNKAQKISLQVSSSTTETEGNTTEQNRFTHLKQVTKSLEAHHLKSTKERKRHPNIN